MRLLKEILIVMYVTLFLIYLHAYSKYVYCINVNWANKPQHVLARKIHFIFSQLQRFDGQGLGTILNKNFVLKYEGVTNSVPFAGTFTGKEGVRRFWRTFFSSVINPKAQLR